MSDFEKLPGKPHATVKHLAALELIKRFGILQLAPGDGCNCRSLELCNIAVDVRCGKSRCGGPVICIWGTRVGGFTNSDLLPIAKEIERQLNGTYVIEIGWDAALKHGCV